MKPSTSHHSRPVFIVGSPRSGTSALTWALGQHPNLLLTEESNWLGLFAVQAAAAHAQGSARAMRSQLSALGITREAFLSSLGEAIDHMIVSGRSRLEAASYAAAQLSPEQVAPELAISRHPGDPKQRWVDGTPEYSLQIPALLYLFPAARFVHILRDADQVAASMLAFRGEAGRPLVASIDEAYDYWMRTTQACIAAEGVLGPAVVHRVRHSDLADDAELAIRTILDFLEEPFSPACLEPLRRRINSSFAGPAVPRDMSRERSAIAEKARNLGAAWLASMQPAKANPAARTSWQASFETSVVDAQGLEGHWEAARWMLKQLRFALAASGVLVLVNWLAALAFLLRSGGTAAAVWFGLASAMVAVYAWLRRAGVRAFAERLVGMTRNRDGGAEPRRRGDQRGDSR